MPKICVRGLCRIHKEKWLLNVIFSLQYLFMSCIVYMKWTIPQHTYNDVVCTVYVAKYCVKLHQKITQENYYYLSKNTFCAPSNRYNTI